ncbi:MAG: methyltransferase domain-containing protein [Magnetococcales bacterium]|nr:methyltransferase domain-containing protein [Magnetococcales bacterium]MBF0150146.1 methyltransferase domain-containing protein [Magnetococcales bacterium]MBF0172175.1 methyltransferase domain-containing protein [Magnetococcales bacterium]
MHHHHPGHRFDPAKAARLLDRQWRLIEDPLELVRAMGIGTGMRVVDLGCGPGFFTRAILDAVGASGHVAAVEMQGEILDLFRRQIAPRPNLEVHRADLCATGLARGQWDVAFLAFTLHEVEVATALEEINAILADAGRLIVLEWGPGSLCPSRDGGEPAGPPADHRLAQEVLEHSLAEAGLVREADGQRLGGCHYWIRAVRANR